MDHPLIPNHLSPKKKATMESLQKAGIKYVQKTGSILMPLSKGQTDHSKLHLPNNLPKMENEIKKNPGIKRLIGIILLVGGFEIFSYLICDKIKPKYTYTYSLSEYPNRVLIPSFNYELMVTSNLFALAAVIFITGLIILFRSGKNKAA